MEQAFLVLFKGVSEWEADRIAFLPRAELDAGASRPLPAAPGQLCEQRHGVPAARRSNLPQTSADEHTIPLLGRLALDRLTQAAPLQDFPKGGCVDLGSDTNEEEQVAVGSGWRI